MASLEDKSIWEDGQVNEQKIVIHCLTDTATFCLSYAIYASFVG